MSSAENDANQSQPIEDKSPWLPSQPSERAPMRIAQQLRIGRNGHTPPVSIADATSPAAGQSVRGRLSLLRATRGVWLGIVAWATALAGTLLLTESSTRTQAELLLVLASVLGVFAWGRQEWWLQAFALPASLHSPFSSLRQKRGLLRLLAFVPGVITVGLADFWFLVHSTETFGLAGWLWLLSMALLVSAALLWPIMLNPEHRARSVEEAHPPVRPRPPLPAKSTLPVRRAAYNPRQPDTDTQQESSALSWPLREVAALAGILILALVLRLWDLANIPYSFNFDEITTGRVAHAYMNNGSYPPVFSTVWSGINLPALWFTFVAGSLNVMGTNLTALRIPAALFGAATVLPFYGMVRGAWGRVAALVGASILAFSAADIHYSRTTLNNIITPFFWALCFFFLLRGLRTRRPVDWLLAGMAGGFSEYFYYGTRLLPFVLAAFFLYLLVIHWRHGWRYLGHFALAVVGYLAAFGPLLAYFIIHPDLYFGRAAGEGALTWDHIPTSLEDLQKMWNTLWPLMSNNLLGISTLPSSDSVYAGPLLMQAEAALLMLGVALLLVRWRHPAAFLMLTAGIGVLFVGGTLIHGTPFIAHWTPAFPAFYSVVAVPVAAWAAAGARLPAGIRRLIPISLFIVVAVLGSLNLYYYFHQYTARSNEEVRAAQDRAQAALGPNYRVFDVGFSGQGWDVESMQYFMPGQEGANLLNPSTDLPVPGEPGKGLAFFFFTDNEQFRPLVLKTYPVGTSGEVRSQDGTHLFFTYILTPQQAESMYGAYLQLFDAGSSQLAWHGQVASMGSVPTNASYPLKARWSAAVYVPTAATYHIEMSGTQASLLVDGKPYNPSGGNGQVLPTGWHPVVVDVTLSGPTKLELALRAAGSPQSVVPTEHLWPLQPGQAMPGAN